MQYIIYFILETNIYIYVLNEENDKLVFFLLFLFLLHCFLFYKEGMYNYMFIW